MPLDCYSQDAYWMEKAFQLALRAQSRLEVPIGAVVVLEGKLIGEGMNQPISQCDPTAHAEINALRAAARQIDNYRLTKAYLYVSLEPCLMCIGAIFQARIKKVVFGAFDNESKILKDSRKVFLELLSNRNIDYYGGIMAKECGQLLKVFFQKRRF